MYRLSVRRVRVAARAVSLGWWLVGASAVVAAVLAASAPAWATTTDLAATRCNVDLNAGNGWANVACDYVGTDLSGGAHLTNLTQIANAATTISQDSLGSYWTGHGWSPCCSPDVSLDGDMRVAFQQASTGSWVTGTIVSVTRTGSMPAAPVDTTTTTTTAAPTTTTTTAPTTTTTVASTTTTASATTTTSTTVAPSTTTTGQPGSVGNPLVVTVGGEQGGLLWLLGGILAAAAGAGFFRLLWGGRRDS